MNLFWTALALASSVLQLLLIWRMQRGTWYRGYTLLFLYVVLTFLADVTMWAITFGISGFSASRKVYALYYWTGESVQQFLIFLVMLSLIRRALDGVSGASRWNWTLVLFSLLGISGTMLLAPQGRNAAFYMTILARNLSFCTLLLNLALWTAVLRARQRSFQLLLVSGGIGFQTAGKAIGHSLRSLSPSATATGNLLIVLGHILCLAIWARAFRFRAVDVTPARVANPAASLHGS